MMIFFF